MLENYKQMPPNEVFDIMKTYAENEKNDHKYINPYFLTEVANWLEDAGLEDDIIWDYAMDMFGA